MYNIIIGMVAGGFLMYVILESKMDSQKEKHMKEMNEVVTKLWDNMRGQK